MKYLYTFFIFLFITTSQPVVSQVLSEELSDTLKMSENLLLKADSLVDNNEIKKAIVLLDSAIYLNPENLEAYSLLGYCYLEIEDYISALDKFDLALILEPGYAEVYYLRGITKLELEKNDEACKDFLEAYTLGMDEALKFLEDFCDIEKLEKELEK